MSPASPSLPLVPRPIALILGSLALLLWSLPNFSRASDRSRCASMADATLRDAAGATLRFVNRRCAATDTVELCAGERCQVDPCAPPFAAGEDGGGRWLEAPLSVTRGDGAQDVVAVWRQGQGGYPHLIHYWLQRGEPRCLDLGGVDSLLSDAAALLHQDESFGFRGGALEIAADRQTVALLQPIYRRGDAGCCPTGGVARVRGVWAGHTLRYDGARRLAPGFVATGAGE